MVITHLISFCCTGADHQAAAGKCEENYWSKRSRYLILSCADQTPQKTTEAGSYRPATSAGKQQAADICKRTRTFHEQTLETKVQQLPFRCHHEFLIHSIKKYISKSKDSAYIWYNDLTLKETAYSFDQNITAITHWNLIVSTQCSHLRYKNNYLNTEAMQIFDLI